MDVKMNVEITLDAGWGRTQYRKFLGIEFFRLTYMFRVIDCFDFDSSRLISYKQPENHQNAFICESGKYEMRLIVALTSMDDVIFDRVCLDVSLKKIMIMKNRLNKTAGTQCFFNVHLKSITFM